MSRTSVARFDLENIEQSEVRLATSTMPMERGTREEVWGCKRNRIGRTDSRFPSITHVYQENGEDDAHTASSDVGNISYCTILANPQDATHRVDSYRR